MCEYFLVAIPIISIALIHGFWISLARVHYGELCSLRKFFLEHIEQPSADLPLKFVVG